MNTTGKLFSRIATTTTMILLALVIALPLNASVLAAAAFTPDDFNRCSIDTAIWDFQNPANLPAASISGQYTGDSALELTVPPNTVATFSNTNKLAPRVMQSATDADFEVEVKFDSPLGQVTGSNWNIQGILVHDSGTNRWLRFDLNTNSTSINYFVGYIDGSGLHNLRGPAVISSDVAAAPLYLRIKYEKALNRWSFGYKLRDNGTFAYRYSFVETDALPGLPNGITFNVTNIGVFAGSTGGTPPGIVSKVDYIKSVPDSFNDDAFTINVQKAGAGNVNWPMTNPSQQCSGSQVTLTASPTSGGSFSGWSGDVTSAQPTIQLNMNRSYNLVATFGGEPIDLPFDFYVPFIRR